MKKLLTVIVCSKCDMPEMNGIEFLSPQVDEIQSAFLARAIKLAKGKYCVIVQNLNSFTDLPALFKTVADKNTDIVAFEDGTVIKTSLLKNLKVCPDIFSLIMLAVLASKSIFKVECSAFRRDIEDLPHFESAEEILHSSEEFKKVKAKLNREIYSYAFDLLCFKLEQFYMCAMLDIRRGDLNFEKLAEFDKKLKEDIVLYLALEKRFNAANLDRLRKKNFCISFFTAKKFRKKLGI